MTNMSQAVASTQFAANTVLPDCYSVVSGHVVAVLKDKTRGSVPHALLVKFNDQHVGILRRRDMKASNYRLSNIKIGENITTMVTNAAIVDGKACIELSERAVTQLTYLFALINSTVTGKIVHTTEYGAFVNIGEGFPLGLCHVSELVQKNLVHLKKGDSLSVVVTNVARDPVYTGRIRVTLSEKEFYLRSKLRQATQLSDTGQLIAGTVLSVNYEGFRIGLRGGVEGFLPCERLGSTQPGSLIKGVRTQVKVVGVIGATLTLSREGAEFDATVVRVRQQGKRATRRVRDQQVRLEMQSSRGASDSSKGMKRGNK